MNNKTGIYIRVSTEEQAHDGFSINAQREKLTKYAEANDWNIYNIYIDDGISGKNLTARPEVNKLLDDVKNDKVNNVLIYKLDRLTRSVKDLIYLIEFFEQYNCTFNSQTEKIDTSNAVGRMFVKIIGIFAEFERENLAERVSFGYEQKTREGNYTNTNGVYGYDYIKGKGILIVNEEEKLLVQRIYNDYLDGMSYAKIAKNLNKEKVPTKRGGRWSPSTINSILTNPLYIGKVRYGVTTKNKSKSFTANGINIEPIISSSLWEKVHSLLLKRKKHNIRRYPSENTYYFHFLKCEKCGGTFLARQQIQRGKRYITYKCNNAIKGKCDSKGFSHKKMEKEFLNFLSTLKELKPDKSLINQNKKAKNLKLKEDGVKRKINSICKNKSLYRKQFIEEVVDILEYKELLKELSKKEEFLKRELNKLAEERQKEDSSISFDLIKDIVKNIELNFKNLNNKEKLQFLENFVKHIVVIKEENDVIIKNVEFAE